MTCSIYPRPDVIADIYRKYPAGADIITNQYVQQSTDIRGWLSSEAESRRMALEGARLARKMADEHSTTWKTEIRRRLVGTDQQDLFYESDAATRRKGHHLTIQLFDAYYEQMDALIEGGGGYHW